jgi:RNA polymerase sigma-70 factor (ECF subfamily)
MAGEPESDADVVARVLAGEIQVFGILVGRYRAAFARYATAMCGDPDLAADAMQEACIRAFDGLRGCRQPERFGAWFFRILTNQCRNHRSRWGKHEKVDPAGSVEAKASADDELMQGELREAIDRALDRLSPDQREAFVLRHVDGRSYREMAELLEEREDVLRMRVHRAREQMRRVLEERS